MDAILTLIEALVEFPRLENVFNPWKDYDPTYDIGPEAPEIRRKQLEHYLYERVSKARFVLCAEAPGYRGAKFSGIAMTDERVLLGRKNSAPFRPEEVLGIPARRTSNRTAEAQVLGMNEMTASVLYSFLYQSGISPLDIVTWNAFPFHPHAPGNTFSNRTPSEPEVEAARHIQDQFFELFGHCCVVAVGNISTAMLTERDIPHSVARHPAFGGASKFREALAAITGNLSRQSELLPA